MNDHQLNRTIPHMVAMQAASRRLEREAHDERTHDCSIRQIPTGDDFSMSLAETVWWFNSRMTDAELSCMPQKTLVRALLQS
jgi:hypothetical protein